MRNNVLLDSGRRGWQGRLQEVYSSREEWVAYDEIYHLAERFGYDTPNIAWDENPLIQGSTNPEDSKVVRPLSEKIAPLLNVLQGGIEMNEGFPLDTDTMKRMVETINQIRRESGLDEVPSPINLE